ncbi:hypothetical protein [Rubrivirga sp.]|uniref:hypothetical protein n=1 Tax=Rubrivirga sp. TaxID=1885344 RepID=UPI003B517D12
MSYRADFTVYGSDGRTVLLVEVKGRTGADSRWASELRRNMLGHGVLPASDYFLVALPDRFFLWRGNGDALREPDVVVSADPLLASYAQDDHIIPATWDEWGMELVVLSWLNDLTSGHVRPFTEQTEWIQTTGLLDAVRGGWVEAETADIAP